MSFWSRALLALALLVSTPFIAAKAQSADPAVATVQTFYDALLDSMKGGKTLGPDGRYAKMKPAVEQAFEIGTMVKYAVGPAWDTMSAADQDALTKAFTRMTAAQYAGNFDNFNGEKFVVDPAAAVRGTDRYVSSKLVTKDQSVGFIYRVRQFGANWRTR